VEQVRMLRTGFRASLAALEDDLLLVGREVQGMVGLALQALERSSPEVCRQVLARDDEVDGTVHGLEEQVHRLLTLEGPVAEDLRLLLALQRVSGSVERIGDGCVNIARLGADLADVGGASPALLDQVHELARRAERAVGSGLDAFGQRRLDAGKLEVVEDQIDLLHEGLTSRLIDHAAGGRAQTEWAIRIVLACRHLERIGDHAVKIAREGAFVATGRRPAPRSRR
jgi:phosphate transport system protein